LILLRKSGIRDATGTVTRRIRTEKSSIGLGLKYLIERSKPETIRIPAGMGFRGVWRVMRGMSEKRDMGLEERRERRGTKGMSTRAFRRLSLSALK